MFWTSTCPSSIVGMGSEQTSKSVSFMEPTGRERRRTTVFIISVLLLSGLFSVDRVAY